jgi:hypothetical protein
MRRALIAALLAAIAAAGGIFLTTAKNPPQACGEIFSRADTDWNKTCEFEK